MPPCHGISSWYMGLLAGRGNVCASEAPNSGGPEPDRPPNQDMHETSIMPCVEKREEKDRGVGF